MKKMMTLGLALCMSSTVALAQPEWGDATYLPQKETKSNLTRSAVLAKTDSTNLANTQDSTYGPAVIADSKVSRSEVINKMASYEYNEFGDGTSQKPWVKKSNTRSTMASK